MKGKTVRNSGRAAKRQLEMTQSFTGHEVYTWPFNVSRIEFYYEWWFSTDYLSLHQESWEIDKHVGSTFNHGNVNTSSIWISPPIRCNWHTVCRTHEWMCQVHILVRGNVALLSLISIYSTVYPCESFLTTLNGFSWRARVEFARD